MEGNEREGINDGLIERIKEIFVDTRIRGRIGEQKGEVFWIGRGELATYCWLT